MISITQDSLEDSARTGLRLSFQIPQAMRTFRQHRPSQCTHVRISKLSSPQQLLACLLPSELAPHHSTKKHVVAVHLSFLLSNAEEHRCYRSAMLQSPSTAPIAIQMQHILDVCKHATFQSAPYGTPIPQLHRDEMERVSR